MSKPHLAERFLGLLPVRTDDGQIAWDPHMLAIAVLGSKSEEADVSAADIASACVSEFIHDFQTIQFLWGDFFDGWAVDLNPRENADRLVMDGFLRPILGGAYLAGPVFPNSLFPALPLGRGRPDRAKHDIEGPAREAALTQLYLMERYVAGFVAADGVERSSVFSASSIGSLGDAILHLTAVNQGQGGAGAGHAANAEIAADHEGLMRLALEVGAKRWRRLCGNVRGQQVGWDVWTRGRKASASCPAYAQSAEFQSMATEFAALADAWDRASSIRTGQQQARREMQTGQMGIGQALAHSGLPREQLERVAGRSRRPPEPQMIASIARRLEFDITTCHPSRQILRPIALALAAASAYERRQELPASDTTQGVIARHAVSNMAAGGYEADAIANGFGQDWPLTTLASIDRQLTRPLSRLPKQLPDRAGAII